MWKIKALYALESVDEDMLDIVEKGPYVPMYQPLKNNAPDGVMKKTPKENWTSDDKRKNGLDVRARAAISYAFPYNIFGLVQNCISAKEMMDTLTVSFEGTEESSDDEVKCLMAKTEDVDECEDSTSSFDADMSDAVENSRKHNTDSPSMYQVKNFVSYSMNDKNQNF